MSCIAGGPNVGAAPLEIAGFDLVSRSAGEGFFDQSFLFEEVSGQLPGGG